MFEILIVVIEVSFFPVAKEKILRLFTLLSSFGIQSWADDDINNFSQHVS